MFRLALLLTCALAAPAAALAQTFSFQTIDNGADPTFNQLLGINDAGLISGYYGMGSAGHPNKGYLTAPPYTTFKPLNAPGSAQTQATGLNAAGDITGFWSDTNTGTDANFGFVALPVGSKYTFIDVNAPAVASSPSVTQILGINKNGIAVGFYNDAAGNSHGLIYNVATATYQKLNIKGATSTAITGINDSNLVSGFYTTSAGVMRGFTTLPGSGIVTSFLVPHATATQLLGVNNAGVAVGFYMDAAGMTHGLYYTPATGAWLTVDDPNGTNGSVVNGINNNNQLVGFYTDAGGNVNGMLVTVTP